MTELKIDDWTDQSNRRLKIIYGIDFEDAGLSKTDIERFYAHGETPEEFVDWYGQKYDLTPLTEWNLAIELSLPSRK